VSSPFRLKNDDKTENKRAFNKLLKQWIETDKAGVDMWVEHTVHRCFNVPALLDELFRRVKKISKEHASKACALLKEMQDVRSKGHTVMKQMQDVGKARRAEEKAAEEVKRAEEKAVQKANRAKNKAVQKANRLAEKAAKKGAKNSKGKNGETSNEDSNDHSSYSIELKSMYNSANQATFEKKWHDNPLLGKKVAAGAGVGASVVASGNMS